MKIGIVVADYDEYAPFLEEIKQYSPQEYKYFNRLAVGFNCGGVDVICINCGIGKVNAATAATHLADMGCTYILNYGLSGGISRVHRGEVELPDKFLEHDFDLTGIGYKKCEKPRKTLIFRAFLKTWKIFGNGVTTASYSYNPNTTSETWIVEDNARNTLDSYALSIDGEQSCLYGDDV